MLTKIEIEYGETSAPVALEVPLLGVTPKDSLLVRSISGLTPPDQTLFIGERAGDGGFYQGRRTGTRNVVIVADINPNPALGETVDGWRKILYKTFMDPLVDADYVRILLHDHEGSVYYTVGNTEKFESEIFSNESMFQVSLICSDPYIRDLLRTTMRNPPTGWITTPPIIYTGTAETGFVLEIHPNATQANMWIDLNGRKMQLTTASGQEFNNTELVYVNTIQDERAVRRASLADVAAWRAANDPTNLKSVKEVWDALTKLGQTTSLLGALSNASTWLYLHSQANVMSVYSTTTADASFSIYTVEYRGSYWGL